jgi:hypothetical protein
MFRRAAGLAFLIMTAFPAAVSACTPLRALYEAPTPAVLAERLLSEASAIVYARVRTAADEAAGRDAVLGSAEIEVLERFKGSEHIERIHTWVRRATCRNPSFVAGEERLFALYDETGEDGRMRYFEIHAWRNPHLDSDELRAELRTQAGSK